MDLGAIGVSFIATRCPQMLEVDSSIATNKVGWYKLDMLFQPKLVWRLEVGHYCHTMWFVVRCDLLDCFLNVLVG
jgi:hypothetical protein